ncbi:hypothetical protein ACJJI5_13045 [Microbulbifer sp. EKSA008]|uniref:hypothetical protein n=1 Tax=unclassified Microbulbifer TaxID=2619833 RepID=UPI0039B53236
MADMNPLDLCYPLIEQVKGIYWLPFRRASSFQYFLGDWSLSFFGQRRQKVFDNSKYAPVATLIDESHSYSRRDKMKSQWGREFSYISFCLYPLSTICSVKVGLADFMIVGAASFDFRVIQVGESTQSRLFNVSDHNQLKQFIFKMHNESCDKLLEKGYHDSFTAWGLDEIQEHKIKGRSWYEVVDGSRNLNWRFNLYTQLSDRHLLQITYEPSHFWPPYHTPSKKALRISKSPLWDFMDNLKLSKVKKDFPVIKSIP